MRTEAGSPKRLATKWLLVTSLLVVPTVAVNVARPVAASHLTSVVWTKAAPSPLARVEALGAVVGAKLYVFSGYLDTSYTPTVKADAYDTINKVWTPIADMPRGTTHAGTAVNGTNVYIAGGYVARPGGGQVLWTKAVWKYDTILDQWTAMPSLPEARGGGALAVVDGQLHFFGGTDSQKLDRGEHFVLPLDGSSTIWTKSPASLPNPRNHLGGATLDGKIYAVGGQRGRDAKAVSQTSVHFWDPLKPGTWTATTNLPRGRSHITAGVFVTGGHIVIAGGNYGPGSGGVTADVTAYDPASASWAALTPLPVARRSGVAASVNDTIFYTTGSFKAKTTYKGVPAS